MECSAPERDRQGHEREAQEDHRQTVQPARLTAWKLVRLIHRLSLENPLWGPEHIRNELLILGHDGPRRATTGHDVGVSTVARYMARRRPERLAGNAGSEIRLQWAYDVFALLQPRNLAP